MNERAAGNRAKPRNVRPNVEDAAVNTAGVQIFGTRSVVRHITSDSPGGRRNRGSSRSRSCSSNALDRCAITRQLKGEKNVGMATISTRHRLPSSGGVGAVAGGHAARIPVFESESQRGGNNGPNSRGAF